MFAHLTMIKNATPIEPLVVSDTSDAESLQYVSSDGSNLTNPLVHAPTNPTYSSLLNVLDRSQNPSPESCNPDTKFSTPKKVEIQITDESIVSGPPLTSKGFPQMAEILKDATSRSNHSSDPELQNHEDSNNESDAGGPSTLLPSATIYTTLAVTDLISDMAYDAYLFPYPPLSL